MPTVCCEIADTPQLRVQVAGLDASGHDFLIQWLGASDPVARAQRKAIPAGLRHEYLLRFNGTDLCQWHACNDGTHKNSYGRLMRICAETVPVE